MSDPSGFLAGKQVCVKGNRIFPQTIVLCEVA
jgi:hypothetical protein